MRRTWLLMIALVAVVGCSSTPFTAASGSGGAGGTSGANSGGASGGSGTAGAPIGGGPSTDAGTPCDFGKGDCPSDMFCDKCTSGICVRGDSVPPSGILGPVCGCDGLTYWNLSVAYQNSMGVRRATDCAKAGFAKSCTPGSCPSGASCNLMQQGDVCVTPSDSAGACWVLPKPCPLRPRDTACGATASCASRCELISAERPWYVSGLTCQ